jgi:hypothetical protein
MMFALCIFDIGIGAANRAIRSSHIEYLRAKARARPLTDSQHAWLCGLEKANPNVNPMERTHTTAFGAVEQVRRHLARIRRLSSSR